MGASLLPIHVAFAMMRCWWVMLLYPTLTPAQLTHREYYSARYMSRAGVNVTERDSFYRKLARRRRASNNRSSDVSVFEDIYRMGAWGHFNGTAGGSGFGSLPEVAVGASRIIYHVVMMLKVKRVIDAPCGGMAWQRSLIMQLGQQVTPFSYLGIDIVPDVIERNRARFHGSRRGGASVAFLKADISSKDYTFPTGYDLIFSRDALMHLSNELIRQALLNMACSDAKHLLLGSQQTWPSGGAGHGDQDIITGEWRPLDLAKPPFELKPRSTFYEHAPDRPGLCFYLFDSADLRSQLHTSC